jgi:hypothetical protein
MRVPINKGVDATSLAEALTRELGLPVAVSSRNPGVDDRGKPVAGVIVLIDPATGDPLPDQDSKKITRVLAGHAPPDQGPSTVQAFADAVASAASLDDLKAALLTYTTALLARENRRRAR